MTLHQNNTPIHITWITTLIHLFAFAVFFCFGVAMAPVFRSDLSNHCTPPAPHAQPAAHARDRVITLFETIVTHAVANQALTAVDQPTRPTPPVTRSEHMSPDQTTPGAL